MMNYHAEKLKPLLLERGVTIIAKPRSSVWRIEGPAGSVSYDARDGACWFTEDGLRHMLLGNPNTIADLLTRMVGK